MKTIEFKIEGMTCGGCAGGVKGTLNGTNGIENAEVYHETKIAKINFDENIISEKEIFDIVINMKYTPSNI